MKQLLSALIRCGALAPDSIITARHGHSTRFGHVVYTHADYVLLSVRDSEQGPTLQLREQDGEAQHSVVAEDITAVDGMTLLRYAEIYNINPDGSHRSMGRKRGRKPKIKLEITP